MPLPKIDLTSLPDLQILTGLFGAQRMPAHDDRIVVLAAIVYDSAPPGGGLI